MAGPLYYDRVKETTTTTGTGTVTLAGAVSGFRAWSTVGDGNTAYYLIVGGAEFEVGLGTYTASGTTLARSVIASSNANALVNFSAGSKDVVLTLAAAAITGLESITFVSITGAISLTSSARGKTHVCSGTSANYTVDLPTSGMTSGDTISFRMADGLTKLVTLDAGGGVAINGTQMRVLHNGETATLEWDGSNWYKRSGVTIPMVAQLHLSVSQSIPNTTMTKVLLDTPDTDVGNMVDVANNQFVIRRSASYQLTGQFYMNAVQTVTVADFFVNGSSAYEDYGFSPSASFNAIVRPQIILALVKDDQVDLRGFQASGGAYNTEGGIYTNMAIVEIPSW